MNTSTIDECVLWEPCVEIPKTPEVFKRWVPLYPVCFAKISPSARGRGWFWIYECVDCGEERLMSLGSNVYNNCKCKKESKSPYPKQAKGNCHYCGIDFIYTQNSNSHIIKYCSVDCKNKGKSLALIESLAKNKEIAPLRRFNRKKICMRKNKFYELCDNYHECQEHRVNGEMGPLYKTDSSCYVFTGINSI